MLPDLNRFRMFPDTLVAYQGHVLLVTDIFGQLGKGIEGLYFHQTRLLSRLTFTVDGRPPLFVSANAVDAYSFIAYYLAPAGNAPQGGACPDEPDDDGGGIVAKG
ncbi:MAG TPA: glycogen debranching N-terminal domain-containing protein, partial [Oscillatoriaceae cyanobacterium]